MQGSTRFAFDVREIDVYIAHFLEPYIGPAAHVSDHSEIIRSAFAIAASPYIDTQGMDFIRTRNLIASYGGIPSEVVGVLVSNLIQNASRMVRGVIGSIDDVRQFEITIDSTGCLMMEEIEMSHFANYPEKNSDYDPVDDLINKIHDSHENGDWLPPKLRDLAKIY